MFRKIVSSLPFSPALVGQLSFYAKRLKKEELTRRLGLIFTVLALVVQSFAVFQAPEAVNAASPADFVRGGVSNVQEFLRAYDSNSNNIKTLFTSLGITRSEIKAAKSDTIGKTGYYNWSMTSLYSHEQGQRAYTFYEPDGTSHTVYNRPMKLTQEGKAPYPVFVGHSQKFGWFAIKKDCGNLITKKRPPVVKPPASSCKDLSVATLTRTRVRFDAKATVSSGAKIKSYTFTVKNANGKTIHTKTLKSSSTAKSYIYDQAKVGTYKVSVKVDTSVGVKKDSDCSARFTIKAPPATPTAVCSGLSVVVSDRTNVEMTGTATVSGGATIKKYTFVITDSTGKAVATKSVTASSQSAAADAVDIATPGSYTAKLTVTTSIGDVTDATDCVAKFSIEKPAVCAINPSLPAGDKDCQPCPGNPEIWIKDADCEANIVQTKTATNVSHGNENAATLTAKASDKIAYTIRVENRGFKTMANVPIEENLRDVLEYSQLADNGGGAYNDQAKTLSWTAVSLAPGESQSRTFVVQLASKIPATNYGTSNSDSYNCVMTNTFGNSIDIKVQCPTQKVVVEQVVKELPHTGPRENMIFAGVLLSVVTYFYARSRQVNKEIRLIRRNIHAGTI